MSDAISITHAIKDKVYSPKEIVTYYIQRLKEYNDLYNILADQRFEEALIEAKQVDLRLPFAGVPILTKDLQQSVKGLKHTMGSRLYQDRIATADDNLVQKLKKLGFIILGSTNVPEFGLKYVSDSQAKGTVFNPLNPYFHAGGSSGGAASAVKANLIPLAMASDAGGSIRVPASFCGLTGFKPSRGAMPMGPDRWRGFQGAAVPFALTSSVRDMKLLYYHLQSQQMQAPFQATRQSYRTLYETPLKQPLHLAFCLTDATGRPFEGEAKKAVLSAVELLTSNGHQVEEVPFPFQATELLERMYGRLLACETAALFEGVRRQRGREIVQEEVEDTSFVLAQYGKHIPAYQLSLDIHQWDQLAAQAEQFFDRYDALLYPSTARTAPAASESFPQADLFEGLHQGELLSGDDYRQLAQAAIHQIVALSPLACLANLTGQPAISLPLYKNPESHMPVGVEFLTKRNHDDFLMLLAEYLEPYFKK